MMEAKICPCGQPAKNLFIHALQNEDPQYPKYATVNADCCGEWQIEFRNNRKKLGSAESNALALAAWNAAPRSGR